ncbi:MAG: hypothetical protein Q8P72_02320 [Candidatus Roizmanbacteria bacterium]|nr:hypothetical protein [Candidatus Roizmanbacteria bacterium]
MKDTITFDDFMKLDMQVGEVLEAIKVEDSNKLLKLTVNMGEATGIRTILTGMQKWYSPEDFIGKKFLFLANLKPRKMAGSESQGMILSAIVSDVPKLLEVPLDIPNGTTIE